MTFQLRNNLALYYRLFFVILFLLLGFCCLGTVLLEKYTAITIIIMESAFDKKALHSILSVMGVLGICTGFIMIYLMREKRIPGNERRQITEPVEFEERRAATDRRIV